MDFPAEIRMVRELARPATRNTGLSKRARFASKSGDESPRFVLQLVGVRNICANKVTQIRRIVRRRTWKRAEGKEK